MSQWVEPPPPQPGQPGHPQQAGYPAQPGYAPPPAPPAAGSLVCPKCRGEMRTFNRNNVHIEQCLQCRGIFLDFGELENLTQLEGRMTQAPPPPPPAHGGYGTQGYGGHAGYGPGWGSHGGHHYRKGGFGRLFFST